MKKQILNMGKTLSKQQQQTIVGGGPFGLGEACTRPSGNTCNPNLSGFHGDNPACNINEACMPSSAGGHTCQCPD